MGSVGPTQLSLPMETAEAVARWHAPAMPGELERIRQELPDTLHFATYGFRYPGWHGIVWREAHSAGELEQIGLAEYAAHPLFTAAYLEQDGVDVADNRELRIYAAQLPSEMECVMQVHSEVTTPRFLHQDQSTSRGRGGQANRHFLDSRFFMHEILGVYQNAFGARLGRFLFTFPPMLRRAGISAPAFAERLDRFLSELSSGHVASAVEVREPEYLTRGYGDVLASHGVAHVCTTWPDMPSLAEQARLVPPRVEVMIQVLDGSGRRGRRERLEPFDQVRVANPSMRQAVVDLVLASGDRPTFVLVHNDAEGCAPLTVLALARMVVGRAHAT